MEVRVSQGEAECEEVIERGRRHYCGKAELPAASLSPGQTATAHQLT